MNNTTSLTIFDIVFPPNVERAAIPFIIFVMIIIFIMIVVFCTICIRTLRRKYGLYINNNKVYSQNIINLIDSYPQHSNKIHTINSPPDELV